MSEWKKVKFLDFIVLQRGFDLTKDSIKDGPYPVVCSTSIMGYHNNYKVEGPGVVTGRSGTLGETQYVKDNFWPHNTTLFVKDFKGNNRQFVYYFLKNFDIASMGGGAAIPSLNRNVLSNLSVTIPDLSIQNNIATILSRYDSLIENYQKQIKLLEEAAQRLYKEWFIDLRFPGHENTKIVDGVPEGWEKKTINDICTHISSGSTPSRRNKSYWENGTIKWVKTKELLDGWIFDTEEYITDDGLKNSSTKIYPVNSILMAIYASPTLGRLGILASECCCNQAALCLIANDQIVSWQWLYWKLFELRDEFNSIARGAGQQNISGIVVKNKEVLVPTKQVVDAFTNIANPIFESIKKISSQIRLLTEARDRLLPKLMSGEIAV